MALIDLSDAGSQPMANEDGTVQVVFNGEIYAHQEVREELKRKGHLFRGTSDTEVLVHLYEEYGEDMLQRLRGMFAFAVYDARQHRVLLARDRYGIKPLYYAICEGQLLFTSELKAILALPGIDRSVDRQACYDYLGLGYVPDPLTGFQSIHTLPAGGLLVADASGERCRRYAEVSVRADSTQELADAAERAGERLLQAVARQSVADVPVAALLSGGIDSSLVVAAYSRALGTPPNTFNVRFPDREYDETHVALSVSRQYRTRHEIVDLADEEAITPEGVLDLLRHFDQPFADSSLIPTYWVSRAIRRRGIICTLSGDGGDEVFGGYARFWRADSLVRLMRLPPSLCLGLVQAGTRLAPWTRDLGRQAARAATLAHVGRKCSGRLLAGLSNYLSETEKQKLVRPEAFEGVAPVYGHFDGFDPPGTADLDELSERMTGNLFRVGLPGDMLRKVDMMSMRAGIEVRVPMLDEEVVELGLSLPHRLKTDGRTGKLVLRELARQWLPPDVVSHRKRGFQIPLDRMVTDAFHAMLSDYLLSSDARTRSIFSPEVVQEWLTQFQRSRAPGHQDGRISRGGLYQRVFIMLSLEVWLREHNLSW